MSVELAGVVLAGGASRRMGRDKATLPIPGPHGAVTMVEAVVDTLTHCCAPIFVVAAPGQPLPGIPAAVIVRDEIRGLGPLLATGRGLRAAAQAGAERAFVCAVDMPAMTAEFVGELAAHDGADVILPWDGRDHFLAAVYRTALADRIDQLAVAGERSMRALADTVNTQRIVMAQNPALANVNAPADISR